MLLLAKIYALLPRMRGYDIVQFINPLFFELKAKRLYRIFNTSKAQPEDRIRRLRNGCLLDLCLLKGHAFALQ